MSKPTVTDLVALAIAVPDPEPYVPLSAYGKTIHILYTKKNMTYSAIATWLACNGLEYTLQHVRNAYKEWLRDNRPSDA